MKKLALLALVLGLLFVVVPASATHVNEPTAPITNMTVRVFKYASGLPDLNCDGTDVIDFSNLRIEPTVTTTAFPSEHFAVRVHVLGPAPRSNFERLERIWDVRWNHQNIAPHPGFGGKKVFELNFYNQLDGPYRVDVTLTGSESGNIFTFSCPWVKV